MLHSGEGGKGVGGEMYAEKESGTVGSTVGEERGGRCRAQNDRWLLQVPCVPCHIKCIWPPPPLHTHTNNVHMHIYTLLQCHPHRGSEEADPVVVLLP